MTMIAPERWLNFALPPELEAGEPPEARGLRRDQVRLLVSYRDDDRIVHARFANLPEFLRPGDLVVANDSATLPAALTARRSNGSAIALHLSTHVMGPLWVVEPRKTEVAVGEVLALPGGGTAMLLTPYASSGGSRVGLETRQSPSKQVRQFSDWTEGREEPPYPDSLLRGEGKTGAQPSGEGQGETRPAAETTNQFLNLGESKWRTRLWVARLDLPTPVTAYLYRWGRPIAYPYVRGAWPLEMYQTVYATEPGSAEMPSAGRAFTPDVLERLSHRGVGFVTLTLHTGVASQEAHEPPFEEAYSVPTSTAFAVNSVREASGRVIAVGTTVVRALESAADEAGRAIASRGWTDLVITPERGVRMVDGLLTGFHEPEATHLAMLEAIAGRSHVAAAYRAALDEGYLWHEFGDLHLLLP